LLAQWRIIAGPVEIAKSDKNGAASDVVCAAFVTEQRAVATSSRNSSDGVAADRCGTRSGDEDNCRAIAGGRQGGVEIGAHLHGDGRE
jgi:hypothetical protein